MNLHQTPASGSLNSPPWPWRVLRQLFAPAGFAGTSAAAPAAISRTTPDAKQPVAGLSGRGLKRTFGTVRALDDVNLEVKGGELVALLGPSGSGKTTLLRAIAGMETLDSGEVYLGGERVDHLPVRERNIGFVFQHYALFPTMTVGENVGFALRARKVPRDQRDRRARELLELMQLGPLIDRFPAELSGGQRQRVAFARALAPSPRILLLDEPFGALDARVREDLRAWLRRMHDEIHVTSVFVTHDQQEAFEVSDRVVIMAHGQVLQEGSPATVWESPASAFVIEFLGGCTRFVGGFESGFAEFGPIRVPTAPGAPQEGKAWGYVRATDVRLVTSMASPSSVRARLGATRRLGSSVRSTLYVEGVSTPLAVQFTEADYARVHAEEGDTVFAEIGRIRVCAADLSSSVVSKSTTSHR